MAGQAQKPAGASLAVEIASDDDAETVALWSFVADAARAVTDAADAVAAAPAAGVRGAVSATVALSSDAGIRALNAGWRGKDTPTNVLSFPAPPGARDDAGRRFLGDVVLAAETIHREARELAIPPRHHLQHLVVHGLLHLLGFDHEDDAEAEAMETLETAILSGLGVPDPYAPAPAA